MAERGPTGAELMDLLTGADSMEDPSAGALPLLSLGNAASSMDDPDAKRRRVESLMTMFQQSMEAGRASSADIAEAVLLVLERRGVPMQVTTASQQSSAAASSTTSRVLGEDKLPKAVYEQIVKEVTSLTSKVE